MESPTFYIKCLTIFNLIVEKLSIFFITKYSLHILNYFLVNVFISYQQLNRTRAHANAHYYNTQFVCLLWVRDYNIYF